jgi:hypothetical protein
VGNARERGTVLLMVIGVLALLAIIAVVYAAIGQADRRAGTAYVRSVQVEDISDQFGQYVAGIIGEDTLQVIEDEYPSSQASRSQKRRYHALWTYPGMPISDDIYIEPPNNTSTRFKPVGGSDDPARQGYQPWLAPSEPTFLRFNDSTNWTDPDRQYLNFRDWASISNVSPNGQFVNLVNLRNNFLAQPGVGFDANNRPKMGNDLTLYDQNGLVYAAGSAQLEDGRNANEKIAWHWMMRQRQAARPIEPFAVGTGLPGVGQPEYIANSWADADGDGIADARWFELSGLAGPRSQYDVPGISQQDRARYFAAVRVVDLTGMVNVSTATDLLTAPGPLPNPPGAPNPPAARYPFGLSGGDVDLLRALTLSDVYERYGPGQGGLAGYALFQNPPAPQAPGNYLQYTNQQGTAAAKQIGLAAYHSLQLASGADRMPGSPAMIQELGTPVVFGTPFATQPAGRQAIFGIAQGDNSNVGYSALGYFATSANPNTPLAATVTRSPFGLTEELDLHAFYSANDPRQVSRLEATLDGRRTTGTVNRPSYGPLRSTRELDVERGRRGDNPATGLQDNDSLAQQHLDLRHRITTINGSRPLTTTGPVRSFDPNRISENEVRVDLREFLVADAQLPTGSMRRLFNHIADALMPYRPMDAFETGFWNTDANPKFRPLFYGNSPDFAIHAAAHLTANLRDAVDNDNSTDRDVAGPTAFTLRTTTTAPQAPDNQYPYPQVTLPTPHLDLAQSGRDVESQRVNIYGIEAQPFLVEAGSYAFWTDVPWDATPLNGQISPDHEWRDNRHPNGPSNPPVDTPITIDDDATYENADYLGEIVAFQVTNPFDRDIFLTRAGASSPEFIYYVEYAGRYFPLAEMDQNPGSEPVFRNASLKLNAGETRTFFATSPRQKFEFDQRFGVPLSSRVTVPPGTVPPNFEFLREFVQRQFRKEPIQANMGEPVHTTMVDAATWSLIGPTGTGGEAGMMDLHGQDIGMNTAERKEIKLWRVMSPDAAESPSSNIQTNDMLADRMRDPERSPAVATMYQRLDSGPNDEVPGTVAGDDRTSTVFGGGSPRDNTGFNIVMWGAIRRPTNPIDPTQRAALGAMPPWCLEARTDQIYSWPTPTAPVIALGGGGPIALGNLNKEFSGPGGRGNQADYGGAETRYTRMANMISDVAQGSGGTKINDQMRDKPDDKKQNPIPVSLSKDAAGQFRLFRDQAVRISLSGLDASGVPVNQGLFRRAGDILLPLAIGPSSDPRQANENLKHLTLAEALAIATDYYSPPAGTLYNFAGHSDVPAGVRAKLDQGHLVLDAFVPFNDVNNNGVYDPDAGNNKERPLGLGIPMALNLLDMFRMDSYGGTASSEIGRVNINTSSILTNSLLPLAAPDPLTAWMTTDSGSDRVRIYDPATQQSDLAATLQSYRDKLDTRTRPLLNVSGNGLGDVAQPVAGSTLEISFRDTTTQFINPWERDGRQVRTQIPGLREEAGFRSIGEVLAARLAQVPTGVDPVQYASNSVDRYARDGVSFTGQRGVETVNVRTTGNTEVSDQVVDDYNEKLAVANALLGSITVRSDVFCVYFVVHGYQASDVQNLSANDPLVPSLARRYMMIVDRSNVARKGDKPRILLFNEVPM